MGSDMAMESRGNSDTVYAEWEMLGDVQVLSIYRHSWYDGAKTLLWQDDPNESNLGLINTFVPNVPPRPEPVFSLRTRLFNCLEQQNLCDGRGEAYDKYTLECIAEDILEVVEYGQAD